jgi:hypothetical protein
MLADGERCVVDGKQRRELIRRKKKIEAFHGGAMRGKRRLRLLVLPAVPRILCSVEASEGSRCQRILGYSFASSANTMARPRHGTKRHVPGTGRLRLLRARAWHGPAIVSCLGFHLGPQCWPRHDTVKWGSTTSARLPAIDSPPPSLLIIGYYRWLGGVYKLARSPRQASHQTLIHFLSRSLSSLRLR